MGFGSPGWLLVLLPWAVVVIYLLPGRGTPAVVPFLGLWRGTVAVSSRTARRWPGAAIGFALLGLLMVILAAAQPMRAHVGIDDDEISIVLDRGATMALPSISGKPFRNVIARAGTICARTRVNLIPVPGEPIVTSGDAWAKTAEALSPTAIRVHLDSVITSRLRSTRGRVLVLSDQPVNLTDKRVVRIQPEPVIGTVAITALGAKSLPRKQVMVRLENHSDLKTVSMTVKSGDAVVRREVMLPTKGQSTDEFVDLPSLGDTVMARAELAQQKSPWLQTYLGRQSTGVVVAVDPAVNDSLRRLAEVYAKHRPAGSDARHIFISSNTLDPVQSGIWIVESSDGRTGPPTVVQHDTTRNVQSWPGVGSAELPPDFTPVVSIGGNPIVAVREEPARQMWVNADLREWEKTPDFVVFFADALEWIGGNEVVYTSVPPTLDHDWPGVYALPGGKKLAVSAGGFPALASLEQQFAEIKSTQSAAGEISIVGPVIFAALGCLVAAAFFWRSAGGSGK